MNEKDLKSEITPGLESKTLTIVLIDRVLWQPHPIIVAREQDRRR